MVSLYDLFFKVMSEASGSNENLRVIVDADMDFVCRKDLQIKLLS